MRILLATDAASEGIDLQLHCHRLIHYDIPFNPNRLEQRIGLAAGYELAFRRCIPPSVGGGIKVGIEAVKDHEAVEKVITTRCPALAGVLGEALREHITLAMAERRADSAGFRLPTGCENPLTIAYQIIDSLIDKVVSLAPPCEAEKATIEHMSLWFSVDSEGMAGKATFMVPTLAREIRALPEAELRRASLLVSRLVRLGYFRINVASYISALRDADPQRAGAIRPRSEGRNVLFLKSARLGGRVFCIGNGVSRLLRSCDGRMTLGQMAESSDVPSGSWSGLVALVDHLMAAGVIAMSASSTCSRPCASSRRHSDPSSQQLRADPQTLGACSRPTPTGLRLDVARSAAGCHRSRLGNLGGVRMDRAAGSVRRQCDTVAELSGPEDNDPKTPRMSQRPPGLAWFEHGDE